MRSLNSVISIGFKIVFAANPEGRGDSCGESRVVTFSGRKPVCHPKLYCVANSSEYLLVDTFRYIYSRSTFISDFPAMCLTLGLKQITRPFQKPTPAVCCRQRWPLSRPTIPAELLAFPIHSERKGHRRSTETEKLQPCIIQEVTR